MTKVSIRVFEFEGDLFDFPSRFEASIPHYRTGSPDFIGYGASSKVAVEDVIYKYREAKAQDVNIERYLRISKTAKELETLKVEL